MGVIFGTIVFFAGVVWAALLCPRLVEHRTDLVVGERNMTAWERPTVPAFLPENYDEAGRRLLKQFYLALFLELAGGAMWVTW